ncbi:Histone-lysine N-methyltransferase ATX1 [Acorus calamus]|uniref:Histone-lysine N-methyltransferase ATX1 n=1 Tax=Acorus calamus TaxID=4465 RepID=A0AAV9EVD9_ACOCL|nr:Histone-lysine N-methyltransferase ATX1 [Acorus calamus]
MCSHAATSKLSPGNCIHAAERPFISCVEHIENVIGKSPLLFTSTCDQNHLYQGGRISSLGQYDGNRCILANNDFHSAQWKDVPRRLIGNADDNSVGSPLVALEDKETIKSQLIEGNAKANDATSRVAGCLREQQTSDFCSGMSAPAPTDVSVEVDNMESIGDAVAEAKSMDIIDEGSRIEKCGSSDEAPVSRMWEEDLALTNKIDLIKPSSENLPNDSSHPTHDVKLMKTSKTKKVKKQDRIPEMVKHAQEYRKLRKIEKRKKATKWKRLDASFSAAGCSTVYHDSMDFHTESHGALSEGMELILQPDNLEKRGLTSFTGNSGVKRKRSLLSLAKSLSWKGCEELQRKDDDAQTQPKSNGLSIGKHKSPVGKNNESTVDGTSLIWKEVCEISGKIPKCSALDCLKSLSNTGEETFNKKMKPIVCGTMGIITNGNLGGKLKPPKIVSLRSILKTAKRRTIVEGEHGQPTILETKETCFCKNEKFCNGCSNSKEKKDSIVQKNVGETGYLSMSMRNKACFNQNKGVVEQFAQKEMHDVSHETGGPNNHHYAKNPKQKETRKRSLGELTGKSKHAKNMRCLLHLGERKHPQDFPLKQSTRNCSDDDNNDNNSISIRFRARKFLKSVLQSDSMVSEKSLKSAKDIQERMTDLNQLYLKRKSMEVHRLEPVPLDSDAFCCVCGGSSNDEVNQLLKCNRCLIKVHQACYGVSKMPKGHWYCRPCKSNSKNIVCVLCGYEGGAMTKALRSHNIVKSLLKAWKVETGSTPMGPISLCESVCDELHTLDFVRGSTEIKESSSSSIVKPTNVNKFPDDVMKLHALPHTEGLRICDNMSNKCQVYNTITAGVFDPSVMQWVHMVCGLWTPGTRCPNVDTMNAFDVSGASPARKNIVCSMCNRAGGSCIRCRVVNCSIHFHPWCAHQKGLLQSENEGPDDESVGFYGRCMLHANSAIPTESCFTDNDLGSTQREEFTCARTEGYKGRKSEDGFSNTHCGRSGDGGGCLVPQEQINAWLHINGQKSCTRPIKSLDLDVEHDCRKEYSRYKQAKGWKKLVVYKSGIHALGLYTSQFISRGAMVVEYVGEIVGPRVADKREIEYQSGSKLQYKSACYFFRIDKEHIIDATRKGGIARFVNHSCLPNCVAKVVTVRNEKKVVFFAERDINPGEEITYDYHFNHEDEGKKIPCFCRSRNCRRYLN